MYIGDAVYKGGEEVKVRPLAKAIKTIIRGVAGLPEKLTARNCIADGKEREALETVIEIMGDCWNNLSKYVHGFLDDIAVLLKGCMRCSVKPQT